MAKEIENPNQFSTGDRACIKAVEISEDCPKRKNFEVNIYLKFSSLETSSSEKPDEQLRVVGICYFDVARNGVEFLTRAGSWEIDPVYEGNPLFRGLAIELGLMDQKLEPSAQRLVHLINANTPSQK